MVNAFRSLTQWGVISENTTWSGTVFVSGDIRIARDKTLTISPGTTVYVWPDDINYALNTAPGGVDNLRAEIWVDGILNAVGTQSQPIKFIAYDPTGTTTDDDAWYGFFITVNGTATFRHCTIRNARYGIESNSNVSIRDCLIQYSERRGVSVAYSTANNVIIRNTIVRDVGEYGINVVQGATLHIAQSTVRNVGINGIQILSSTATIDTITCRDNNTAVYLAATPFATVATLRGCTINRNTDGVSVSGYLDGAIRYCEIDSNATSGIYLDQSVGSKIERNHIRYNTSGIFFAGGSALVQKDNVIEFNGSGIKCDLGAVPTVRRCKIASNTVGVAALNDGNPDLGWCDDPVPGDTTTCATTGKNNISGNTSQHVVNLSTTVTILAEYNYWGSKVSASKFSGDVLYEPYLVSNPVPSLVAMQPEEDENPSAGDIPKVFDLGQNRPNPFNPTTTMRYAVPAPGSDVEIGIFDVMGRRVATLVRTHRAPGFYDATWDGTDQTGSRVASGVYFVRMHANQFDQTRKIVLLK